MLTPFEFGCTVAGAAYKRAADAYAQYQSSGHAGTMSYADWQEANADTPAAPPAPSASPAQPEMQLDPWSNNSYPKPQAPKPTSSMYESLTQWRPYQPTWAGKLNPSNYKFSPTGQK